jgi:hypothetical protein
VPGVLIGISQKRWMGVLANVVAAATLVMAYDVSAGRGAPNPCPGNYVLRATAPEEQSVSVDLNGNGLVCAYQGAKTDVAPFKDDRVK